MWFSNSQGREVVEAHLRDQLHIVITRTIEHWSWVDRLIRSQMHTRVQRWAHRCRKPTIHRTCMSAGIHSSCGGPHKGRTHQSSLLSGSTLITKSSLSCPEISLRWAWTSHHRWRTKTWRRRSWSPRPSLSWPAAAHHHLVRWKLYGRTSLHHPHLSAFPPRASFRPLTNQPQTQLLDLLLGWHLTKCSKRSISKSLHRASTPRCCCRGLYSTPTLKKITWACARPELPRACTGPAVLRACTGQDCWGPSPRACTGPNVWGGPASGGRVSGLGTSIACSTIAPCLTPALQKGLTPGAKTTWPFPVHGPWANDRAALRSLAHHFVGVHDGEVYLALISAFGSGSALAIPSEPQPFQLLAHHLPPSVVSPQVLLKPQPGTSLPSGLACPTSRQLIHHPTAVDVCPAPWPKKRSYPRTSLGLKTCEPTGTQKAARGKRHLFSWAMIQRTGKLIGACHPCAKGQRSTIKTSYTSRFEMECSRVHHLVSHATTITIKHLVLPSPILLIEDARTWCPAMLVKQQ